jgi:hypothetical protein
MGERFVRTAGQGCLLATHLMGEEFMTSSADWKRNKVGRCIAAWALGLAPVIAPVRAPAQQAPTAAGTAAAAPAAAAGGIANENSFPAIESGKWTGERLADGQPDVSGDWSNTIANHDNFTDPQGGIPGDPSSIARNRRLGLREERAPSRVSDPTDGQLPYQPWAREKQQEFAVGFFNAVKPEYIEPLARCAPSGIPKSLYWHGYEIRQFPGYIVFLFGSGWRIIHLDGKPHLPANIKLWNGDSRGHWEGNTLVVDVDNENSKARFARRLRQRERAYPRALHLFPGQQAVQLRRHLHRPDGVYAAGHGHHSRAPVDAG